MLDVLTAASAFFTLGGSLAVRGASGGVQAGRLARFAGLEPSLELSGVARGAGRIGDAPGIDSSAFRSAAAAAEGRAIATLGRKGPIDRMLTGSDATGLNGRVRVTAGGEVLVPRTGKLVGIDGTVLETVPLASSWSRRAMTEAGLKASNSKMLVHSPLLGSETRAGKIHNRIERIKGENASAAMVGRGGGQSLKRGLGKLDDADTAALFALGTIGKAAEGPKALGKFWDETANTLERRAADGSGEEFAAFQRAGDELVQTFEAERKLDKSRSRQRGDFHDKYLAQVAEERAREAGTNARAATVRVATLRKQIAEVDRRLAKGERPDDVFDVRPTSRVKVEAGPISGAPKNVVMERATVQRTQTLGRRREQLAAQLAREERTYTSARAAVKAQQRVAKTVQAGGLSKLRAALHSIANEQTALRSGNTEEILQGLRARADLFNSDAVEAAFRNPTKHMLRVMEAQGNAARYTTDFIKGDLNKQVRDEMADGTLLFRMAMRREPTPEEMSQLIVRSHARAAERTKNVREVRRSFDKKPTTPKTSPASKPEFTRYSKGYNFAMALDSMSPAGVFKTFNEARAYRAKVSILQRAAASGIRVTSPEDRARLASTGAYEFVGGDRKLLDQAHALRDKLDNEVRLVVGDSAGREQASELLTGLIEKYTADAGEWAMPKAYHKQLTQELRRADNFLTRFIDTPTAVFRAAVLNLRPAWIANNFVGQMMLLLYGQGVYHGVREYMEEVVRTSKAGAGRESAVGTVLRERAGALTGEGGMGREFAETGTALSKATGTKWLVDWPGVKRTRDAAGKPEGSLAAHAAALSLKSVPSGLKGLSDWMGRVNTLLTDDIPRRAAFMSEIRPVLARIQKGTDLSTEDALRLALADDEITARLIDKTMGDLIDFSRMNPTEREVVRRLLPFYGWMKGITLRTGRMIRDEPFKAAASYQLGKQYSAGAEERFGGPVPDYLKGALKLGEDENGKPRVLPTGGLNIFQTPADIAGMVMNPLGGEGGLPSGGQNPLSSLNPVIKAPLEVAIGKDLFYGGPLYSRPELGPLGNLGVTDNPYTTEDETRSNAAAIASRYLSAFGPLALYQRYQKAGPAGEGDQRLLARSKADALRAYAGFGAATLNPEAAAKMANDTSIYGLVKYDPAAGERPFAG